MSYFNTIFSIERCGIVGLSAFLNVNGYDFPCPKTGFSYTITTTVSDGRDSNNAVIGQRVGRDQFKLDNMEWAYLDPRVWQMMLRAVEPFFVPVTFEDYRTGLPITIIMYPGDRVATPLFVDSKTHKVTMYENCAFNLIDAGKE